MSGLQFEDLYCLRQPNTFPSHLEGVYGKGIENSSVIGVNYTV